MTRGAFAWGTALALQALRVGGAVSLWVREPARALAVDARRENALHLPGTEGLIELLRKDGFTVTAVN